MNFNVFFTINMLVILNCLTYIRRWESCLHYDSTISMFNHWFFDILSIIFHLIFSDNVSNHHYKCKILTHRIIFCSPTTLHQNDNIMQQNPICLWHSFMITKTFWPIFFLPSLSVLVKVLQERVFPSLVLNYFTKFFLCFRSLWAADLID